MDGLYKNMNSFQIFLGDNAINYATYMMMTNALRRHQQFFANW